MENILIRQAPAKVNLSLDILGRRADGYHEMKMINHAVRLEDRLTLIPNEQFVLTGCPVIDKDKNLITKALEHLSQVLKKDLDFHIDLQKQIPMEAGLAGGSADAAAAIKLACSYWNEEISPEFLKELAHSVGADIPYCLSNSTALIEGIGEKVTKITDFKPDQIALIKPDIAIATSKAFSWVDQEQDVFHPDTEAVLDALAKKNYNELRHVAGNSFLGPVAKRYPEIQELIDSLYDYGAFYAGLSGSGSTVVGYFDKSIDLSQLKTDKGQVMLTEVYDE